MAVYQFFAGFENNINFGQKVFTGTDFRSRPASEARALRVYGDAWLAATTAPHRDDIAGDDAIGGAAEHRRSRGFARRYELVAWQKPHRLVSCNSRLRSAV